MYEFHVFSGSTETCASHTIAISAGLDMQFTTVDVVRQISMSTPSVEKRIVLPSGVH
jgi:hypothetical protein